MIFYFSGTGNSKWVANSIADKTGEKIIEIKDNIEKEYTARADERIGIVFPVYWYGLPKVVLRFLQDLKLNGYSNQYVFATVTYGIKAGSVMNMLDKYLKQKNINLNGRFGVKMVDNYVVGYNIANDLKKKDIVSKAKNKLEEIIPFIVGKEEKTILEKGPLGFVGPVTHYLYMNKDHTKKFYANSDCINCNACVRECPCGVIKEKGDKLVWEGDCTFCLKCINMCPKKAIQYGKMTIKRGRYIYHE